MALSQALTYKGIPLAAAYYRVVLPQINTDKVSMGFGVWVYASQASAEADINNQLVDLATSYNGVAYDIAGSNPLEQAYAYLKTLDEFKDATSVLETGQTS